MLNTSAIEGMRRFLKHAETLKPRNNPRRENGFAKEFQEIKELTSRLKKDPSYSTKHGEKDVNRPKNRYKDILPYDYTRIILPISQGVDGSDYINGNYIKGPTEEVLYLAAQGPLPQTVNDFWRMIISHQTQVIVMACREYELGKLKCKRYWPESVAEKLTFDGCEVSLISQEEMGDGFIIRTLSAKHAKGELKVTQFHYTAWPDHDVPRSATPLIELTMSFRAFVGNDNKVPVLAHCSAGCGRTGTICALDFAMNLIKLGRTDNFSVFDIVSALRKQRIAMVQTKEQYELVYKAVKEIVSNELLKQRSSMHTYVNVAVGEEPPPVEQTYENVEFIRSIQRLHEEEKNASRRPKDLPSSPHKAIVVAPSKDVVLAPEQKGFLPQNRAEISANRQEKISANQRQGQLSANQNQESARKVSKENLVQSSTKPPIKKKPASGYENVLPLSVANATAKPPVVPMPQNYVNVFIGDASSDNEDNDYVNIPPTASKAVPVPEKTSEPLDKTTKVVPVPPTVKPVPPHPGYQRMSSSNAKDNGDYVIPPLPKKTEKSRDYVIPPNLAPNVNIPQIPEGNLIDLCDSGPSSLPLRRASSEIEVQSDRAKMVKQRSLDSTLSTDLSRSTPALQSKDSDAIHHLNNKKASTERKQAKITQPLSGQYSLVGAFEELKSPTLHDNRNPFENVPKGHTDKMENVPEAKERSSFSMVESVVSDSAPVKLEKPIAVPRRESEGSPRRTLNLTPPQGNPIIGVYSEVNIPNSEKTPDKNDELLIDLAVEPEKESPSSERNTPNLSNRLVQKAYSTENVSNNKAELFSSLGQSKGASTEAITKKPSLGSNLSDYSLVSVPYTRRRSEDVLSGPTSSLYSSADGYMPKKVTGRESENAVQSGPRPALPDSYKPMKATDVSASAEKRESGDVLGSGPTSSLYSSANSYMPKKPVGLKRSHSGVTPPIAPSADLSVKIDVDSLYATVGAKTKDRRRSPIPADIWSPNGYSPSSSLERGMNRSNNSSSSLRSINSTSSNDSLEDAPPIPQKTADAFALPGDEDAYETVQKSSSSKSTLDRFKSKAKTMISGPHVSKLSLGKKTASPLIASSDSLASGYGSRVGKPAGPRQCPSQWPKFAR